MRLNIYINHAASVSGSNQHGCFKDRLNNFDPSEECWWEEQDQDDSWFQKQQEEQQQQEDTD